MHVRSILRRGTALALGACLAGTLAACGGGGGAANGTITFWMKKQLLPEQNDLIEERVAEFEEARDVEVELELIAYEDFYPKWAAALESGEVPDVSFFGYQEIGQFYAQGAMADVSDVVKAAESANGTIAEQLKEPVTFEGKQYGVPFWAEAHVLYYRKDLLAEAGYDQPPATWEEFRAVAADLTDPGANTYGAGIGYGKGNSDAEWITRSMAWSYGGSLGAPSSEAPDAAEGNTKAANLVRDIFLTDKSAPSDALNWDDSGNNRSYLSGQSAMTFNVGSLLASLEETAPDVYENTGVAPLPAGSQGSVAPGLSNYLGIFEQSDRKDLAGDLIGFLLKSDWYASWTEAGAPLNIPVYDELRASAPWTKGKNAAFAESVENFVYLGHPAAYSPAAGEIYNLRLVNNAFQKMLVKGVEVETALGALSKKVDQVHAQSGGGQ